MSSPDERDFSEDLFAHTRMSFWDHIEELRMHLWKAIAGFVIALVGSLFIGHWAEKVIAAPVQRELEEFYDRRLKNVVKEAQEGVPYFEMLNQPTAFQQLRFDRSQLHALFKGSPSEEVSSWPRPLTQKELDQQVKDREDKSPPPGTKLLKENEGVTLWVRIEKPIEWASETAKQTQQMTKRPTLSTLSVTEAFIVWLKCSMYVGVVIASPWIFWQLWSFIAAGLYPSEKRYVHHYLPFSVGLFLSGVAVCEFIVIPTAVHYLLSFNEWMGLEPDLRLSEWLHFAILFPLVFGVAFQTPLIMLFLHKAGICDVQMFRQYRRIALFSLAVISMLLTVSPDPLSMLAMMFPLWILYELGILLCRFSPRPEYEDELEAEDMVGV